MQKKLTISLPVLDPVSFDIMCKFDMCKNIHYIELPEVITFNIELDKSKLENVLNNIIFIYDMSFKQELKLKHYLFYITAIYF